MNQDVVFRKVGHACFLAQYDGKAILFDPWFGTPVNYGVFHAFPDMVPPTKEELESVVAIHISHIHDDHFDIATLAQIPKHIPVVIGKFKDPRFRNRILQQGFSDVIELDAGARGYQVGPFALSIFPKFPLDTSFDSSAVLTVAGMNFYVGNDCIHPHHVYFQILHTMGRFEGGFIGHTILNPALWCSDFSECESFQLPMPDNLELAKSIQAESWHHIKRVTDILKFKWVSPYSSDFRFFNIDLIHHNAWFFPASEIERVDLGEAKSILLNPGEKFRTSTDVSARNQPTMNLAEQNIPKSRILPSWIEAHCPEVDIAGFATVAAAAQDYFHGVIQRQSSFWTTEILIEIRIQNETQEKSFRFYFDGEVLKSPQIALSKDPDLILEYPARGLAFMFQERLSLRSFHSLYLHKAQICNIRYGQMSIMHWS